MADSSAIVPEASRRATVIALVALVALAAHGLRVFLPFGRRPAGPLVRPICRCSSRLRSAACPSCGMGWYDCHLHEFVIGERHYGVPDPDGWDPLPVTSEKGVPLLKALGRGKRLNDFGDGWEHTVTVERRLPPPLPGSRLGVMCVAGENACPPEDVGGRRVTRTS